MRLGQRRDQIGSRCEQSPVAGLDLPGIFSTRSYLRAALGWWKLHAADGILRVSCTADSDAVAPRWNANNAIVTGRSYQAANRTRHSE